VARLTTYTRVICRVRILSRSLRDSPSLFTRPLIRLSLSLADSLYSHTH
jgi:hypothetical protein